MKTEAEARESICPITMHPCMGRVCMAMEAECSDVLRECGEGGDNEQV
jgi:hypothetical protein